MDVFLVLAVLSYTSSGEQDAGCTHAVCVKRKYLSDNDTGVKPGVN